MDDRTEEIRRAFPHLEWTRDIRRGAILVVDRYTAPLQHGDKVAIEGVQHRYGQKWAILLSVDGRDLVTSVSDDLGYLLQEAHTALRRIGYAIHIAVGD